MEIQWDWLKSIGQPKDAERAFHRVLKVCFGTFLDQQIYIMHEIVNNVQNVVNIDLLNMSIVYKGLYMFFCIIES